MEEQECHDFVVRLIDFLGEEDFETSIVEFLNENAPKIGLANENEELSHEAYGIYNEYLTTVEKVLERFMEREGLSEHDFHAILLQAKETNDNSSRMIDAVLASWEFGSFMDLAVAFQLESDDDTSSADTEELERLYAGEGGAEDPRESAGERKGGEGEEEEGEEEEPTPPVDDPSNV